MERKGLSGTAATQATQAPERSQIRKALARTATTSRLSAEEERALRMRHGVASDLSAPLPRAAGRNAELADELTLIEMQLLRTMRAHGREPGPRGAERQDRPAAVVTASKTKDKIVRALRKKR